MAYDNQDKYAIKHIRKTLGCSSCKRNYKKCECDKFKTMMIFYMDSKLNCQKK